MSRLVNEVESTIAHRKRGHVVELFYYKFTTLTPNSNKKKHFFIKNCKYSFENTRPTVADRCAVSISE